jgi:mono/diheme cytochrome c family protein/glucose/arabinose dehydrogenase
MKRYIYASLILAVFTLYQCQSYKKAASNTSASKAPVDLSSSPVIPADQSIGKMQIEDGFDIQLIAAEPLVTTPVAMVFDNKERMWVVEMNGYMPDTLGTGEDQPNGRIVILEDKNKDGIFDTRKVAIDSLVLPRSICLVDGGILVAEPPNLWYYDLKDDKPVKKTLVDAKYATEGNVEHQPNGLLRTLDNWIYNAKSAKRYRKKGDQWLIDDTHFRGQWGISQDNYGRVYYNDNSSNVQSDYFSPGFGAANQNQKTIAGYYERTVPNNRTYPIRPTPGVNRGYMKGTLDDSLRLANFTAACSPLVYRGDLFGKDYDFNVFVAEPSGNLIKRNILKETGYIVKGEQAYKGREFLASTDERFRPVSLYNGPDGALYVLDMYRGIIQHKTYVTPYLANQIKIRNLTQPLSCGRIYKIVPKGKKAVISAIPQDAVGLVAMLGNANGFLRDMAQQTLIDRKVVAAIPLLKSAIKQNGHPLQVIHALWTLEGLNALETNEVLALLKSEEWPVRMQALTVIPSVANLNSAPLYIAALRQMLDANDELAAPYIAFLAGDLKAFDEQASNGFLVDLAKKYPNNAYVSDAVISNLAYREEAFKKMIASAVPDTGVRINKQLQKVITAFKNTQKNRNPELLAKQFPKGSAIFRSTCQTCHGPDGNGTPSLAPPLNKSQWVNGDKNNLISIVLFGLTGPINVNGHVYEAPEVAGDMPGIGHNDELNDEDIAQLLSFIRQSWQNDAARIDKKDILSIRDKYKGRQKTFTMPELEAKK